MPVLSNMSDGKAWWRLNLQLMTEAAANKWVHQSDDLFIRFINNIHYEGTSLIEMPATIITVLKNTKKNVPDVILDLISVVGLYSTADFVKTFIRMRFFVDKQLINLK